MVYRAVKRTIFLMLRWEPFFFSSISIIAMTFSFIFTFTINSVLLTVNHLSCKVCKFIFGNIDIDPGKFYTPMIWFIICINMQYKCFCHGSIMTCFRYFLVYITKRHIKSFIVFNLFEGRLSRVFRVLLIGKAACVDMNGIGRQVITHSIVIPCLPEPFITTSIE